MKPTRIPDEPRTRPATATVALWPSFRTQAGSPHHFSLSRLLITQHPLGQLWVPALLTPGVAALATARRFGIDGFPGRAPRGASVWLAASPTTRTASPRRRASQSTRSGSIALLCLCFLVSPGRQVHLPKRMHLDLVAGDIFTGQSEWALAAPLRA